MKTIEERAKQAGVVSQVRSDYPYDKRSVEFGYTQGAYEQKAIDIDKACEWLKAAAQCGVDPCNDNSFVEDFRKAMEE